jgi:zinc transport system substrate-binding protein
MRKSLKNAIGILTLSALVLAGCGTAKQATENAGEQKAEKKLKVVTTFYPMYDFTKNIVGDYADVVTLIPSGAEPHDWEPTPKDMETIQQADVLVYNGAGMERWVDKVIKSTNNDKLKVVEASKGIDLMEGTAEEEEGDEHGNEKHLDPHVWLSPVLAQKEVKSIEDAVVQADPSHKDIYEKNAEAYISKLNDLDKLYKDGLTTAKRKDFITQHAAFAYLAKQYGLQQVPIAGLSPEQEPSAAKMTEIIKFAKEHQVKTVFFETLVTPKVAEVISKEIGAKTAVLNPIEGLTREEKAKNLDYIGVMKNNLEQLQKALNE